MTDWVLEYLAIFPFMLICVLVGVWYGKKIERKKHQS